MDCFDPVARCGAKNFAGSWVPWGVGLGVVDGVGGAWDYFKLLSGNFTLTSFCCLLQFNNRTMMRQICSLYSLTESHMPQLPHLKIKAAHHLNLNSNI